MANRLSQSGVNRLGGTNRLATSEPVQDSPNILTRFIRSLAEPALKTGVTGLRAGQGIVGLATGNKDLIKKGASQEAVDFGYLGKVGPVKSNLDAIGTGASVGLDIATSGLAPKVVKTGLTKLGERATAKLLNKVTDLVSPRLVGKKAAKEIARVGTQTTGLLRKITLKATDATEDIAKTVMSTVKGFNPNGLLSNNINAVKNTVTTLAEDLKSQVIQSGKNKLFTFKELASRLDKIGKGADYIGLKGTQFEQQLPLLKNEVLNVAKKSGGTIANLFDARKSFDVLVERTYPNLYDKEYTVVRQAVSAIRNEINNFIADNLTDVAFKESLLKQHRLYQAIENMSSKAAVGELKELGTNAITRFARKNPNLTKAISFGVGGAVGTKFLGGLGE